MRQRQLREMALAVLVCLPPGAGLCRAAAAPSKAAEGVHIERETYRGWPDTYRLSNGLIEARVLTAVGPRVIDLRAAGGPNLFYVRDAEAGGTREPQWVFRGGWRLWIAPEQRETTYVPDNEPCAVEIADDSTLRVTGPPQAAAGIQKQIEVSLAPGQPRLRLRSRIRNVADRPVTYAAWSLSVMRPGGRAFVPLDVGPLTAFDAVRRLVLWSYTELADPRYRFRDRLIEIDHRQVRPAPPAQVGRRDDESKIGVDSAQGWAGYLIDGTLYLKRFPHDPSGRYPDGGSTIEIYSSAEFLEVEQLSPLTTLAPGEELVFPEDWWVFTGATVGGDEAEALAEIDGYLTRTQAETRPPQR